MPKTRAYTREELQGLRRADLQRLCKTYDIKGANAKSNVLIDLLAEYFTSPAYRSSPRPETSKRRRPPNPQLHQPPTRALTGQPRRLPQQRQTNKPTGQTYSQSGLHSAAGSRLASTSPTDNDAQAIARVAPPSGAIDAQACGVTDELVLLRQDVFQLRQTLAKWEDGTILQSLETKIEERLATAINQQMRIIQDREAAVIAREAALDSAWARLEAKLGTSSKTLVFPEPSSSDDLRAAATSGADRKRKQNEPFDQLEPVSKRQCVLSGDRMAPQGHAFEQAQDLCSEMVTQSSLHQTEPRTPSPPRQDATDGDANTVMPIFATDPKPEVPYSLTLNKPDRSSRGSGPPPVIGGAASTRPRSRHPRRKPSQAHIDLSAITESEDEPEVGSSGPALDGGLPVSDQCAASSPALSPSPAIGGDNFNYTTMMAPQSVTSPKPVAHKRSNSTRFSPAREYMNVALNGLSNPQDSPGALATPGSRTMIGTERFRDTRFADEPLVPWNTPTIDWGPETPTH